MQMTAAQLDVEINELHKKATEDLRRPDTDLHVAAAVWHKGEIVRALTIVPTEVIPADPEVRMGGIYSLGALMAKNMPSGPLLAVVISMTGYSTLLNPLNGDISPRQEAIITMGCNNSGHNNSIVAVIKERADAPLDIAGWSPEPNSFVEVRKREGGDIIHGRVIGMPPEDEKYQVLAGEHGIVACDLEEINPYPSKIVIGEVSEYPPDEDHTPGPNGMTEAFWEGWLRARRSSVSTTSN